MLFYRAPLPLSSKTLNFVSGIVRRHRKSIGSPWRTLDAGGQALLVLVYLKKDETYEQVAAGFEVSTMTAWRYVDETVALPAGRAPKLRKAARDAKKAGYPCVVADGTLIAIDRVAAGPAVLLRQAQEARHEPAGHRQPLRGDPVGLRGAVRRGPR
jgi:hypothetical protein